MLIISDAPSGLCSEAISSALSGFKDRSARPAFPSSRARGTAFRIAPAPCSAPVLRALAMSPSRRTATPSVVLVEQLVRLRGECARRFLRPRPLFPGRPSVLRGPSIAAQVLSASTATPSASYAVNGSSGFGPGMSDHVAHAGDLARFAVVERFERAVEIRTAQHHRDQRAGDVRVDAELRCGRSTMSRASATRVGLPMMWNCSGFFSGGGLAGGSIARGAARERAIRRACVRPAR